MRGMRENHPRGSGRGASSTRHRQYVRPLVGALALLLLVAGASQAAGGWVYVGTKSFYGLCPRHIGGDRDYSGNGPEVHVNVELWITDVAATMLHASVTMSQVETKSDWSAAALHPRVFLLYRAPAGKRITKIWNTTRSHLFYVDTDHAEDRFYPPATLVKEFRVKGDTSGNDIGNCTTDDAYLSVILEPLWVWLEE